GAGARGRGRGRGRGRDVDGGARRTGAPAGARLLAADRLRALRRRPCAGGARGARRHGRAGGLRRLRRARGRRGDRAGPDPRRAGHSSGRGRGRARSAGRRSTLRVEDADGRRTVSCDERLAATGRRPRLEDVGLDSLGLTAEDVTGTETTVSDDATGAPLPEWLQVVGDASG